MATVNLGEHQHISKPVHGCLVVGLGPGRGQDLSNWWVDVCNCSTPISTITDLTMAYQLWVTGRHSDPYITLT